MPFGCYPTCKFQSELLYPDAGGEVADRVGIIEANVRLISVKQRNDTCIIHLTDSVINP
jgi:hypothetical protein